MQRNTLVYLLLAAIAIGAYYYLKNQAPVTDDSAGIAVTVEPTRETTFVFDPAIGQPNRLRIESQDGEVVELSRNADNAWVVNRPSEAAADQGSAEAAASQVMALLVTDQLPSSVTPQDVGLDQPAYTLTVSFADGGERKAEIGVITPSEGGYYVRVNDKLVIASRSGIDTLIGLLINPPYLETPTPPPAATETPLPSPTLEPVTPTEASATPTP